MEPWQSAKRAIDLYPGACESAEVTASRRAYRVGQFRTTLLYLRAIAWEFRFTLLILLSLVGLGTLLFFMSPGEFPEGQHSVLNSAFASWMAMFAQTICDVPKAWYITVVYSLYPIFGFLLIGEGVVRLALLMFSRRHGMKEWMRVMASTYRDHIVVCGIGKLGTRVIEQLVSAGLPVVAVEKDEAARFGPHVRAMNVPLVHGDMKDDGVLATAGIPLASVVIIATNDDMANLEVALDARRMNPKIRVVMRLFEQNIAQKISNAFLVDVAFSASHLAAPIVAAMSVGGKVLASTVIAGVPHVTAEVTVSEGSTLDGQSVGEVQRAYGCKLLAQTPAAGSAELSPAESETVRAGDVLTVHLPSAGLVRLAGAGGERAG